jgi:pimeloyl-[acyl-carrier protein] methyl ester esterase
MATLAPSAATPPANPRMTTRSTTHGHSRNAPAFAGLGATTSRSRLPKLILLPGLHCTCELLTDFMAALGDDVPVHAVDYPRDRVLSHDQLVDFVRPLLPVGKPFVLLGESFSGPIAIRLAAERPRGLCGLVLSTSFAASPRPGLARFAHLARAVPAHALPVGIFTFWLLGRSTTPKLRAQFAQVLGGVDSDVLAERLVASMHVDVRPQLAKIDVPLLYLRGTRDRLLPHATGGLVTGAVKSARLVDFDGPHCLLQAIPAQAAKVVREFVAAFAPK